MGKPIIVTTLDIDSPAISGLAARVTDSSNGTLEILAHASHASRGVAGGAIVDLSESVDSVTKVLTSLSEKVPNLPNSIYVNISGENLKGETSRGMIPLAMRGREITKHDIERCANAASTIQLPFEKEIVHKIVQSFSIDDQPRIKNPLGLYGSRLACEVYIITANINIMQNLYKTVYNAGYDVKEVVFSGVADASALLEASDIRDGVLLVDIGESYIQFSYFVGGALNDFEITPFGGLSALAQKCEEYLKKHMIKSIVLSGPCAYKEGVIEFLQGDKLPLPIRMGVVREIRGRVSSMDTMKLTTAIGLAKYAQNKCNKQSREDSNIIKRLSSKVVDIFNNYF